MKVNIKEQYKKRALAKLGNAIPPEWGKYFNEKEISMWYFTSVLIKGDPGKSIYDNEDNSDIEELEDMLDIYKLTGNEQFTLKEWFDYMSQD